MILAVNGAPTCCLTGMQRISMDDMLEILRQSESVGRS